MTVFKPSRQVSAEINPTNGDRLQPLLTPLLLAAWFWLFRPIYPYLTTIFTRQDFRTNQVAMVLLAAVIGYKVWEERLWANFRLTPRPYKLPLLLLISSSVAFVICERVLDINNISAGLFVLAAYGLAGLFVSPRLWRSGFPIMLMFAATLPINHHLQTFVGYPMRLVSASLVGDLLLAAGFGAVGANTILIFENSVAYIDLPCSGAQSLWTGAIFLLLTSWLERKKLDWRWFIVAALLGIMLFIANLIRIAALILAGHVFELPLLAEMLHVPLGILGFVGACLAALWLLRNWVPTWASLTQEALTPSPSPVNRRGGQERPPSFSRVRALFPNILFPALLIITLLTINAFHKPYVRANTIAQTMGWTFPSALSAEAHPLNQYQHDWLLNDGADAADRFRFQHGNLSGSMLFVVASNWHAHHFPERCFAGSGLEVAESRMTLASAEFPVRWLTLTAPDGTPYSAVFWFQSADSVTDDYATRIWDDLRFNRNKWVLVSALFDGEVDASSAETTAYLNDMRSAAQHTFKDN